MTHDSITITWQPPENDGGAPILCYIIVMREASKKKFKKVGKVDAMTLTLTINSDLRENGEYAMRVYAENEEGVSQSAAELKDLIKLPSKETTAEGKVTLKESDASTEESTTKKKFQETVEEAVEETKVEGQMKGKEAAPTEDSEEVSAETWNVH